MIKNIQKRKKKSLKKAREKIAKINGALGERVEKQSGGE
jgi:hypothetical protein